MGRHSTPWSDEEVQTLIERRSQSPPVTINDIAAELGRSPIAVDQKWNALGRSRAIKAKEAIRQAAANPPIETDDKERIRELERENAKLRQQLTWAQHAESDIRTGGVLTIRESDVHHGDANHLLSCHESCWAKVLEVIRQYEPERIQLIGFDDWIAGRGIYKEQDLDMAVSDVNQQIALGAVKARRHFQAIRSVSSAPIQVFALRGNHDHVSKTSMAEALFNATKVFCADVPDLKFKLHWDMAVVNLAAEGTYNVLAMHGFGHSKISPNSPAFIDAVKDKLLSMHPKMQPHEHIQRVLSGHTHWVSIGVERLIGLNFDTTGGFQRNTRVKLGMNQRPVGMIVYVSPAGMDGNILKPLEIKPDDDTLEREIADPHLGMANQKDCAECLIEYQSILRARDEIGPEDEFGVPTQGRW